MPLNDHLDLPKFVSKTDEDRFFLALASAERSHSDDPKARHVYQSGVGAVIVNRGRLVARAANILPPALKAGHAEADRSISEEERYHFIEHAERAAIFSGLHAHELLAGGTIYCTRFACSDCARAIIWAGLRKAVFGAGYGGEARWIASQRAARDMLRLAGVKVRVIATAGAGLPTGSTGPLSGVDQK